MREAPFVEQFAQQNSGKAVTVSIGFRADRSTAQSFASDYGVGTPLGIIDDDNGVAFHYGLYNFPAWLLLDSSGNLVKRGTRFNGDVQAALDALNG